MGSGGTGLEPSDALDSRRRLERIERTEQRLWLLALSLFLLLAISLFLVDTSALVEGGIQLRWPQFAPSRLREHAPAAALLIIAWLVCAYFYEKLAALRTQNRGLVLALEENSRVLAQRNQQLSTWSSLSHSLITNLNLPRLLDLIVRTAAEVTESDCAAALLWERQSRHLRLAAIHQRGLQIELAEKVAAAVIRSGQPLVVCREAAPPEFSRPDLPWEDLVCVASEPLVTRDQVVGALLVARVRPMPASGTT